MSSKFRRITAAFATGAVALAGVVVLAPTAYAAESPGQIHLYGQGSGNTRGAEITSGSIDQNPAFYGISVDAPCPAGFRNANGTTIYQNDVRKGAPIGAPLKAEDGSPAGNWGASGANIAMSDADTAGLVNGYVANKALSTYNLADGAFELRYYCRADDINFDETEPYFVLDLVKTGNTWAIDVPPPPLTPTTTSLVAVDPEEDGTVNLTATVKAAGVTATAANGTVDFAADGSPVVGCQDVVVAAGVAECTTAALADDTYAFTAAYSGDAVYAASTSASFTLTLGAYAVVGIPVDAVIPSGVGELTLTVPAGTVHLDGDPSTPAIDPAVLSGGVLSASGSLPNLTISDTRQLDADDWELTGVASNFTGGGNTILAKYLGWTPVYVSGPGVIGAPIAPFATTNEGLSVPRTLATGAVTDGNPTTVVKANLDLKAPANTPSGLYTSTITVTLL